MQGNIVLFGVAKEKSDKVKVPQDYRLYDDEMKKAEEEAAAEARGETKSAGSVGAMFSGWGASLSGGNR